MPKNSKAKANAKPTNLRDLGGGIMVRAMATTSRHAVASPRVVRVAWQIFLPVPAGKPLPQKVTQGVTRASSCGGDGCANNFTFICASEYEDKNH